MQKTLQIVVGGIVVVLFLVGFGTSVALGFWIFALVMYVFGEMSDPGAITNFPLWAFVFVAFVPLFWRTKPVRRMFKVVDNLLS
ncbi:MAG: hypothetical protein PHI88_03420 [Candidatus Pacebacteria bacterium]|nr:hypothetical protein [Candidatus Paceibacterota bacterium]